MNRFGAAVVAAGWLALTAASSAYMTFIKAPSVAEVRPALHDVGLWTALFSGRFSSWLYLTNPLAGTILTGVIIGLFAAAVVMLQ